MTNEDQIASLERDCATAMLRGDAETCSAVLADDYTALEVIEDQPLQIVLKDAWLERVKAANGTTVQVDDVSVSLHGDVAIAAVKLTETTALTTSQLAITDLWRKEQGWRLVERHQSRALPKSV